MIWTTEKPVKPGWYWYRADSSIEAHAQVVHVREPNQELARNEWEVEFTGFETAHKLDEQKGEWAGPIPEPEVSAG